MLGITDHVQAPKMTELNFSFFLGGGGRISCHLMLTGYKPFYLLVIIYKTAIILTVVTDDIMTDNISSINFLSNSNACIRDKRQNTTDG